MDSAHRGVCTRSPFRFGWRLTPYVVHRVAPYVDHRVACAVLQMNNPTLTQYVGHHPCICRRPPLHRTLTHKTPIESNEKADHTGTMIFYVSLWNPWGSGGGSAAIATINRSYTPTPALEHAAIEPSQIPTRCAQPTSLLANVSAVDWLPNAQGPIRNTVGGNAARGLQLR